MKKVLFGLMGVAMFAVVACGPSKAEQEAAEKAKQDSIEAAEEAARIEAEEAEAAALLAEQEEAERIAAEEAAKTSTAPKATPKKDETIKDVIEEEAKDAVRRGARSRTNR
ncbi:MAG: hypothetical protein ACOXZK_10155 [Bacteroidales bacterium]